MIYQMVVRHMKIIRKTSFAAVAGICAVVAVFMSFAQSASDQPKSVKKVGYPLMESPHSNPIAINGDYVYVTNTPSSTVDVIDRNSQKIIERIHVGIDPVSIAVRPDGKEVWVSNHVSDSVSVIDSDPQSPTFHVVIATIQEFDSKNATTFDEPVGIAFASNSKAYVALSSANQIAVIDVKSRSIINRLIIKAQDPRAITVKGDKLYVIPFESGNRTQISGGKKENIDGNLVTFDAWQHVIRNNNVLSLGYVADIVKRSDQPDKDLFIFDTKTDRQIEWVETLGTLLYGITVDSKGQVFITQTDARNDINGKAGTKKHSLLELGNRPYLNQITQLVLKNDRRLNYNGNNKYYFDLEPSPPEQFAKDTALATPYAIQVSDDDSTLIATAAASSKVFSVNTKSGKILGQLTVGEGPRGIALEKGKLNKAWVYSAFDNTVSYIDVSNPINLKLNTVIVLEDPTNPVVKRGRIYFNSAQGSSTGTFSCASCHPDGHTDQLLWVLDTPIVTGGKQIMPRLTMPVRGLRDTEPFHWDGTKGDPYGGINSANLNWGAKPNCKINDPISCLRQLIDDNIATTMSLPNRVNQNTFSDSERNAMAVYLMSVPYPPAPKRSYTDTLTNDARRGFSLFHVEGDNDPKERSPNICGNCHRMPFLVSARTLDPRIGMKATTWRGAYDRFQITPQARANVIDFPWVKQISNEGRDERSFWRGSWSGESGPRTRFDPVWDMVLEMSTGYSGAFARQVTLSKQNLNSTTSNIIADEERRVELAKEYDPTDMMTAMNNASFKTNNLSKDYSKELLSSLESAHSQGFIVLEAEGVFINEKTISKIQLHFDTTLLGGGYVEKTGERRYFSSEDLIKLANQGKFVGTFTGRHGSKSDFNFPQPALWSNGKIDDQRKQDFPTIRSPQKSMTLSGRHLKDDAHIIIDGKKTDGSVKVKEGEKFVITLESLPPVGMHLLQVQVPDGLLSNEFIFYVR